MLVIASRESLFTVPGDFKDVGTLHTASVVYRDQLLFTADSFGAIFSRKAPVAVVLCLFLTSTTAVIHISVFLFTTVCDHVSNYKTDLNNAFFLCFLEELRPVTAADAVILLRAISFHVTCFFSSFFCYSLPEGCASTEFC